MTESTAAAVASEAGSWPEMHTPAPEPAAAPAHEDTAGADGAPEVRNGTGGSRSFFRAIKEGVLGRRSEEAPQAETRAAEPPRSEAPRSETPRAEPKPEPQAAPAAPPAPEEPAGPPRKGWWSNKT